ncbi:hypothetical protein ACFPTO_14435 [Paraburkholderia denitrificans]|uniref:Uncharacterized protein n=1 Tax=Paraburkholderia denitrificans TaxID=694025 RepID=A0ABW0JAG6_9BURK
MPRCDGFAWQATFMPGLPCRLYPLSHTFQVSVMGRSITALAIALAGGARRLKAVHPRVVLT